MVKWLLPNGWPNAAAWLPGQGSGSGLQPSLWCLCWGQWLCSAQGSNTARCWVHIFPQLWALPHSALHLQWSFLGEYYRRERADGLWDFRMVQAMLSTSWAVPCRREMWGCCANTPCFWLERAAVTLQLCSGSSELLRLFWFLMYIFIVVSFLTVLHKDLFFCFHRNMNKISICQILFWSPLVHLRKPVLKVL